MILWAYLNNNTNRKTNFITASSTGTTKPSASNYGDGIAILQLNQHSSAIEEEWRNFFPPLNNYGFPNCIQMADYNGFPSDKSYASYLL